MLHYYKNEEIAEAKGVIDLKTGLGVRKQSQCGDMQWPKEARSDVSFGIATESRTFYLYGSDKAVARYVFDLSCWGVPQLNSVLRLMLTLQLLYPLAHYTHDQTVQNTQRNPTLRKQCMLQVLTSAHLAEESSVEMYKIRR